jgi:hypothetical protein
MLEHLTPDEASRLVAESRRVLKENGILRIVVPDLESICRHYLRLLDEAASCDKPSTRQKYRWMTLELIDQMVRQKNGGLMVEYLREGNYNEEFLIGRMGDDYFNFMEYMRNHSSAMTDTNPKPGWIPHRIRAALGRFFTPTKSDPKTAGELHKWMYDRLSLKILLEEAGFSDFRVRSFDDSAIPHWSKYNLDRSKFGDRPRKPDSLCVEATRT